MLCGHTTLCGLSSPPALPLPCHKPEQCYPINSYVRKWMKKAIVVMWYRVYVIVNKPHTLRLSRRSSRRSVASAASTAFSPSPASSASAKSLETSSCQQYTTGNSGQQPTDFFWNLNEPTKNWKYLLLVKIFKSFLSGFKILTRSGYFQIFVGSFRIKKK